MLMSGCCPIGHGPCRWRAFFGQGLYPDECDSSWHPGWSAPTEPKLGQVAIRHDPGYDGGAYSSR